MVEAGNLNFESVCTLDISNDAAPDLDPRLFPGNVLCVSLEIIILLLRLVPNAKELDMIFINTYTMATNVVRDSLLSAGMTRKL